MAALYTDFLEWVQRSQLVEMLGEIQLLVVNVASMLSRKLFELKYPAYQDIVLMWYRLSVRMRCCLCRLLLILIIDGTFFKKLDYFDCIEYRTSDPVVLSVL